MLSACKQAKYESILFIPGQDFFSREAISRALNLVDLEPVLLGYRITYQMRPLIKKISSAIFRNLLRLSTNRFIIDPHGLPAYPKSVVLDALPEGAGHALHVYIIREITRRELPILQFTAPVNPNYTETLELGFVRYWKYFKTIWSVAKVLPLKNSR